MDTYTSNQSFNSARPSTSAVLSERAIYISRHPVTQTAALHSSENLIAPVWPSVTATPWDAKAKLLSGGYGSPMHRTKISDDCPAFFFNPHKATNYDFTITRPSFTRTMAKKSDIGNESCYVLPGGESVLEATMKSRKSHADGRKSFRIYNDGKRGMMANIPPPTQRDLPPIDWNCSSRRSTARDPSNGTGSHNAQPMNSQRSQPPVTAGRSPYPSARPETTMNSGGKYTRMPAATQHMQGAGAIVLSSNRNR